MAQPVQLVAPPAAHTAPSLRRAGFTLVELLVVIGVIAVLLGLAGAVSSLATMAFNPFVGMISLIASLLGACMGVILARIVAECVLIVFRINEHLGAIRNRNSEI